MKRVLFILICLLSLAMGRFDMNIPVQLEASLRIVANEMNKSLPEMVDAEIRHDKVEVDNLNLILKFTLVNFSKEEVNEERLKSIVEDDIRKQVCEDEDSQIMLDQGIKVIYKYVDRNQEYISQFIYDEKVCNLFTNIE